MHQIKAALKDLPQRLITVSEYYQMAQFGILGPDEHVELIIGKIVPMSPIGKRHALCVNLLNQLLLPLLGEEAALTIQNPVHLDDYSEPEPDLAIIKAPLSRYLSHHPRPSEIFLVIEVADTTLEKDREVKLPLYANAGIPCCWIVNLEEEQLEIYEDPKDGDYTQQRVLRKNGQVSLPLELGTLALDKILIG